MKFEVGEIVRHKPTGVYVMVEAVHNDECVFVSLDETIFNMAMETYKLEKLSSLEKELL